MKTKGAALYKPSLGERTRVRLHRPGHPEDSRTGTILRVLENPSSRIENQWYDVHFDSGRLGRFLERHLEPVSEGLDRNEVEGSLTVVA